jgi:hypothetical protein
MDQIDEGCRKDLLEGNANWIEAGRRGRLYADWLEAQGQRSALWFWSENERAGQPSPSSYEDHNQN